MRFNFLSLLCYCTREQRNALVRPLLDTTRCNIAWTEDSTRFSLEQDQKGNYAILADDMTIQIWSSEGPKTKFYVNQDFYTEELDNVLVKAIPSVRKACLQTISSIYNKEEVLDLNWKDRNNQEVLWKIYPNLTSELIIWKNNGFIQKRHFSNEGSII